MIDINTISAQLRRKQFERLAIKRLGNPEFYKRMFESMDRGAEEACQERHDAWNRGVSYDG